MFLNDPVLNVDPETDAWHLHEALRYASQAGELIVVPRGFRTDLASIPRILQNLIPVNGKHRAAAILHDYLYVVQNRPRDKSDRLFLEAMAASGVPLIERYAMWLAVRLGGGFIWRGNIAKRKADLPAFMRGHGLS